jgi:hypothetical protein
MKKTTAMRIRTATRLATMFAVSRAIPASRDVPDMETQYGEPSIISSIVFAVHGRRRITH